MNLSMHTHLNSLGRHCVTDNSFLYFTEIVGSPPEETTSHFVIAIHKQIAQLHHIFT